MGNSASGGGGGGSKGGKKGAKGGSSSQSQSASYRFKTIQDKYRSIDQVQAALREAGLESSNLILGVDCTKSNEWTGKKSFNGKCLHTLSSLELNPYENAISIIGRTLAPFDDDDLIPVYGFGDSTTHDTDVFSFNKREKPFHGFSKVVKRYRDLISSVKLSGPTSFAPIINKAAQIAATSGQYHILVIIADGQVTRSSDTPPDEFSRYESETANAIVAASKTPLSIAVIGVGDGPWEMMQEFDDHLPERAFDNFQFVDFTSIMKPRSSDGHGVAAVRAQEARFALNALMEIPDQYRAIQALGLSRTSHYAPPALEPPPLKPGMRPPPMPGLSGSSRHLAVSSTSTAAAAAAPAGGIGAGGGAGAATSTWSCHMCTLANEATETHCLACGNARPAAATAAAPAVAAAMAGSAPSPLPDSTSGAAGGRDESQLRETLQSMQDAATCPVCLDQAKNMVFQCGHQTCSTCGPTLTACPICRATITTRIKMFG